jgi:hypothetical protein
MENPHFRLFILGSGFSKPAGLPLGPELLDEVRHRVREVFRNYDWDGPLEREIEEWKELYPEKELILESVLAYSHRKHFLKLIGSDEYFSHGSRSIVAARTAIQEILTESAPRTTPELYKEFAAGLTANDTVLTFNYDTVLEDALDDLKKPYSLTPEWWLTNDEADGVDGIQAASYVDILKLHGSIDWYDKNYYLETRNYLEEQGPQVPDRDPLFGPDPLVPVESLARGSVETGFGEDLLPRVFRVPNHRQHFPFGPASETVVPFLLPPAHDKLLGHDPIRDIWRDMHRSSGMYSAITLIGYSMPEYDGYAYEALGRLIINYQKGEDTTFFGQRRAPMQIITLASSTDEALMNVPFINRDKTRVWLNVLRRPIDIAAKSSPSADVGRAALRCNLAGGFVL